LPEVWIAKLNRTPSTLYDMNNTG